MQSRCRIHADDPLAYQDHFDNIPDSLVLIIFNKLADVRSLGRCLAVSQRFNSLVPLVQDVYVKIDRIITSDDDGLNLSSSPRPRNIMSHFLKVMLRTILKPFGQCESGNGGSSRALLPQLSHHSPAQVLKDFAHIKNLRMELPAADVGTDDGVLLKWKAEFGSTLQTCVILGGTGVDPKAALPSGDQEQSADDNGSIPESFYTNGGLKLRVVWTISSLIAASTRHHLLRETIKEHPTLESVVLTDAHGQGTLSMGVEQLREFREKPLSASASSNRTHVPACNMKLRYAPLLELSEGMKIQGATLVAIKPVVEGNGGSSKKETEAFVAGAFDGPYREAVRALTKRRTYLLEMNSF